MQWSKQAERRYGELEFQGLQESSRLMNLMAVIFFPLFSVLDYFAQSNYFKILSIIRFSTSAVYFLLYMNRKKTLLLEHPFAYSLTVLGLGSLSITVMCLVMNGYESPYYAGVNLVMLTAVMLFSWGPRRMFIAATLITGIYFVCVLAQADFSIQHPELFLNNAYFILSTAAIGITSAYFSDRLRRESFMRYLRIEEAQADLKKLDMIKTKFFANVSHELRTPAALILGPVQKLRQNKSLNSREQRDLEVVERNARLLLSRINDLLEVARIEAGKTEINYTKVDVAKLARRVASLFEVVSQEKNIDWNINVPDSFVAEVDPEKFQRILMNLISNAFKFTPPNGRILLHLNSAEKNPTSLILSVQDSGHGIPVELRKTIFERFYQVEDSLTRKHSGTGLGLSIVKEFVELHQGEIQVSDSPSGGAGFKVILPVKAPENSLLLRPLKDWTPPGECISSDLFDIKAQVLRPVAQNPDLPVVLVVEDNADMNAYITSLLVERFRVANAFDGKEGIEKAIELQPDLILSDIMMPGYSGVDLLKALRAKPRLDSIPILFLTAKADDELKISLLQGGAQDYILKPFIAEELVARVENWTSLRRAKKILLEEANLHLLEQQSRTGTESMESLALEVVDKKQQLQKALVDVQTARDEAENAVQLREEFLSIASHELKTPITAMKLHTEIFKRKASTLPVSEEGAKIISKLIDTSEFQLKRLGRLIEEMLDFSVINSGNLVLEKSEVDLVALLKSTVEQIKEGSQSTVTVSLQGESSLVGCWDAFKIEQVILNLLTNAVKYGEGKPVEIQVSRSVAHACFQVADCGIGISSENQKKIFNRFERAVSVRHFGGLGLGLYIAKQIVESHGGEITVKSDPGQGSTFTVMLPLN